MNQKYSLKPNKKIKLEHVLLICLVLVMASLVVYLLMKNFQTKPDTTTELPSLTTREFLDINNPKQIVTSNGTYSIPEGWEVFAIYKNPSNALIKCANLSGNASSDECIVYDITDGTTTFYASLKSPFLDSEPTEIFETSKINFLGASKDMFVQSLKVVTRTDDAEGGESKDSDIQFVNQAYICTNNNICFSTGKLSLNFEENSKAYDKFKQLLTGIKLL